MLGGCAARRRTRSRLPPAAPLPHRGPAPPLYDETIAHVLAVYQPLTPDRLTRADAEEIQRNGMEFVALLREWQGQDEARGSLGSEIAEDVED